MSSPPSLTLEEARAQLDAWRAALKLCAAGKAATVDGRSLTPQDVDTCRAEIQRWHRSVLAIEARARGQTRPLGSQAAFPAPGSGGGGGLYDEAYWYDWRS